MERKLASVRRISKVEHIPNADSIEVATVDGWKVVTKKGEYKQGNLCIYLEIDSFLPVRPEFEFLRKSSYKKMGDIEGFRLRTVKLRGQISQGLLLPISILNAEDNNLAIEEGIDVTETLGIIKYEPPIPSELQGKIKGLFPSFLKKTNEERVQNLSSNYEDLKKDIFYVTEKLDGSSATFYFNDGVFGICSRNLELLEDDDNIFCKISKDLNLKERLSLYGNNIAIQGELIGEGIQKNPYDINGQTVKFFNIYDIDRGRYYDLSSFAVTIKDILKLDTIPILDMSYKLPEDINELISSADGKSQLKEGVNREGLVIRNLDNTISFKVISNSFLLNED